MTTTEQLKKYSEEVIAPICEKVDKYLDSLGVSNEEFSLVLLQMTGSLFAPENLISRLIFEAYCFNAAELLNKQTRESN